MKHQVFNPYLPSYEYVPDGEPHVFGGRVYIYGSHDKFNGNKFCMNDYVCWSAPISDLTDWKYEGIIYKKIQDPRIPDPQSRRMFAPDVQQGLDGRFYLYYAFDFSGIIGVAVCDTPAGRYKYYGHVRYPNGNIFGEKKEDVFQYDPGVFVDTDGKVYLYTGFCPRGKLKERLQLPKQIPNGAMVTRLEADMITIKKNPEIIIPSAEYAAGTGFEGHAFFEAPSMRKVNGMYYIIYSSEQGHELCYATSDRPDKGFVYGGTIVSNGDIGYNGRIKPLNYTGTNHGSIEEINGQWYVFYHRQTNGNPYSRQGCAEKIQILPDGKIPQVEITSCGLNQSPLEGRGKYCAGIASCLMSKEGAVAYEPEKQVSADHPYFTQDGEDREDNPGQYIANMALGAVAGFKYFNIKELKKITVKTKGSGNGKLQILTDYSGKPYASIKITESTDWIEASTKITIAPGKTALWFRYEGTGYIDFKSFMLE